jgi:hypothetical protein
MDGHRMDTPTKVSKKKTRKKRNSRKGQPETTSKITISYYAQFFNT